METEVVKCQNLKLTMYLMSNLVTRCNQVFLDVKHIYVQILMAVAYAILSEMPGNQTHGKKQYVTLWESNKKHLPVNASIVNVTASSEY